MIITRYLNREVLLTLSGLTLLLLLMILSNQFVQYLSRVAAGNMPGMIVLRLLVLEIPYFVGLLLPLGLYMAILVAFGRCYADNEMVVLRACGVSQWYLVRKIGLLVLLVSAAVAYLVLVLGPDISRHRDHILTSGGLAAMVEATIPGRFRAFEQGRKVFYVDGISRERTQTNDLFLAEWVPATAKKPANWRIVTANTGEIITSDHGEVSAALNTGHEYQGVPGTRDYRISSFETYTARLPSAPPRIRKVENALPTKALLPFNNPDLKKAAELQWRLAMPIMTLLLAFLAVPLSMVKPRQGKFARLLPAILVYIFYANFLFVSRDWIAKAQLPIWLGMWWLHGLIFITGLILLLRRFR